MYHIFLSLFLPSVLREHHAGATDVASGGTFRSGVKGTGFGERWSLSIIYCLSRYVKRNYVFSVSVCCLFLVVCTTSGYVRFWSGMGGKYQLKIAADVRCEFAKLLRGMHGLRALEDVHLTVSGTVSPNNELVFNLSPDWMQICIS